MYIYTYNFLLIIITVRQLTEMFVIFLKMYSKIQKYNITYNKIMHYE
jgi:hypothetical protein